MSNMKRWLREMGIPSSQLAVQTNQSRSSITQKLNRKTEWQRRDCLRIRELYGLSSDFIQDLIPYEMEFPSGNPRGGDAALSSLCGRAAR
ncbi:XRE family transcriptional regulator [Bifidobacterium vansinderenii]|uniref:XRE family transcriptional regulator n=1 Tax=Bifidobacterium vansinderenii TaxID=1984871 RepID=A0A229VXD0_9BIFI|nr:XRE family transcriptional regulator [Bifidobacterium vansinderenii]OXN00273.1 XRE family transcriptional regulator [Bifidobacterium vansinderenii]